MKKIPKKLILLSLAGLTIIVAILGLLNLKLITNLKANFITFPTPGFRPGPFYKPLKKDFLVKTEKLWEKRSRLNTLTNTDFTFNKIGNEIYFSYRVSSPEAAAIHWVILKNEEKTEGVSSITLSFPFSRLYDFSPLSGTPTLAYSVPSIYKYYLLSTLYLRELPEENDIKLSSPPASVFSSKIVGQEALVYTQWNLDENLGVYTSSFLTIYLPSKGKAKYWREIPFDVDPIAAIKDKNNKIHIALTNLALISLPSKANKETLISDNFYLQLPAGKALSDLDLSKYYARLDPKTRIATFVEKEKLGDSSTTSIYEIIAYIRYMRFDLNTLKWEKDLIISETVKASIKENFPIYSQAPNLYLKDNLLKFTWLDSRGRVESKKKASGRRVFFSRTANIFGRDLDLKTEKLSFEYRVTKNGYVYFQTFATGKVSRELPFVVAHNYYNCYLNPDCFVPLYLLGLKYQSPTTFSTPFFSIPYILTDTRDSIPQVLSVDQGIYFVRTKLIKKSERLYRISLEKMQISPKN